MAPGTDLSRRAAWIRGDDGSGPPAAHSRFEGTARWGWQQMLVEISITSLGKQLRFGEASLGFVSHGKGAGVGGFWCLCMSP